jgi:hypothetical protein
VQISAFLGPSPRICSLKFKLGSHFDDYTYTPLHFSQGSALHSAFMSGFVPEFFFFAGTLRNCGVQTHTTNPAEFCRYYIPTRFLRQAALQAFCEQSYKEQIALCHQFSGHPQLCAALYEVLGLQIVATAGLKCLFPVGQNEESRFLPAGLRILESADDATVEASELGVDRLWIPPPKFPTVDAVAILEGGKLIRMFQLAIARWHEVKPEGIARVLIKFSVVAGVRFEFVFITPSEEVGRAMTLTKGMLSERQPYALRVKTDKRQDPVEQTLIPVGYAVAEFVTPKDQRALAVGSSVPRWTHHTNS